jgi:hypothetical protein
MLNHSTEELRFPLVYVQSFACERCGKCHKIVHRFDRVRDNQCRGWLFLCGECAKQVVPDYDAEHQEDLLLGFDKHCANFLAADWCRDSLELPKAKVTITKRRGGYRWRIDGHFTIRGLIDHSTSDEAKRDCFKELVRRTYV